MPPDQLEQTATFYDNYDYAVFWHDRHYEHEADALAVSAFLSQVRGRQQTVLDVGGGLGRMIPLYAPRYAEAIYIDPSAEQVARVKNSIAQQYPSLSCKQGVAENLPITSSSVDTLLCVRVSHHISNLTPAIKEFHRVLEPGGYLILEVANKLNMKSVLTAAFRGNLSTLRSPEFINRRTDTEEVGITFGNHNPKTVRDLLVAEGFTIISIRSVSNFRSALIKKIVPLSVLTWIESLVQLPLASIWFGPSIYFLAQKK